MFDRFELVTINPRPSTLNNIEFVILACVIFDWLMITPVNGVEPVALENVNVESCIVAFLIVELVVVEFITTEGSMYALRHPCVALKVESKI